MAVSQHQPLAVPAQTTKWHITWRGLLQQKRVAFNRLSQCMKSNFAAVWIFRVAQRRIQNAIALGGPGFKTYFASDHIRQRCSSGHINYAQFAHLTARHATAIGQQFSILSWPPPIKRQQPFFIHLVWIKQYARRSSGGGARHQHALILIATALAIENVRASHHGRSHAGQFHKRFKLRGDCGAAGQGVKRGARAVNLQCGPIAHCGRIFFKRLQPTVFIGELLALHGFNNRRHEGRLRLLNWRGKRQRA